MKHLYRFLGKNSKTIKFIFYLSYIALATLFVASPWMYNNMEWIRPSFREWNTIFAQASIILLLISMTPGILKRLDILKMVEANLLIFRRQFGVLAFFTTLMHVGYSSWTRKLASGDTNLLSIFDSQLEGSIAFVIFFILFVISNDTSMKILKKWWAYLQRLTYVTVILLILHIMALSGSETLIFALGFYLGAEAMSWVAVYLKKENSSPVPETKTPGDQPGA